MIGYSTFYNIIITQFVWGFYEIQASSGWSVGIIGNVIPLIEPIRSWHRFKNDAFKISLYINNNSKLPQKLMLFVEIGKTWICLSNISLKCYIQTCEKCPVFWVQKPGKPSCRSPNRAVWSRNGVVEGLSGLINGRFKSKVM